MTVSELKSMTVVQLRKIAKDNGIVLGSGADKATMVERISVFFAGQAEKEQPAVSAPFEKAAVSPAPAPKPAETAEPKYQAAWHSPDSPHFNNRPAYQAPGLPQNRPVWQNPVPASRQPLADAPVQPPRAPSAFKPRFGPAPSSAPAAQPAVEIRSSEAPVRESPLPDHRVGFAGNGGYTPRPSAPVYTPAYTPAPRPAAEFSPIQPAEMGISAPTLEELLASGDYEEGGGVLELHPDGYGFLRASNFMPSSKDIYVSMAQIRRFGLRTGDLIEGKIRPQREGDKFAALLYISTVNGIPEEEAFNRPSFDELTPVYPSRRISLEAADGNSMPDMRLVDLIAPLGFGQRGLLLCPPETGKRELLRDYAKIITANYPDVTVLMLLIDMIPEDVTLIRESVPCPVLASTFDQSPESHLRLSEMGMERAMRLVEQKKDVVLLVDSLTRLAKIYTTAAVQQGRSLPGMVNPASLFRAKRLFGSARACKEGGSLTVIAAMDIATGSKVDDSVVEEFKGTANMELMLDTAVARAGVRPSLNLQQSFTKNADILLDDRQKEGLSLIRQMLGTTSSAVAIPQLLSMMDKAGTNRELLLKMKDWFALMQM